MLTRRHALLALTAAGCSRNPSEMNSLAERYVKLILAIGEHDPNYVDAFYGPPEWKAPKRPIEQIAWQVGYSDPAAFRKLFQRITGLAPADYRRRFGLAA